MKSRRTYARESVAEVHGGNALPVADPVKVKKPFSSVSALTVLVVDDVQENIDLLEYHLTNHSYQFIAARDGQEALALLGKHPVDLIVSDAMMPTMDGFQLCREVKSSERFRTIPFVIYTSNYLDEEDAAFARRLGVDRYVMKSDITELLKVIREVATAGGSEQNPAVSFHEKEIDDGVFLKKHHELVVKKLDEKIDQLKMYTEMLSRKNRELEESERRYRGLFEHSSIMIFSIDGKTGRVLEVNRQGQVTLGYTKEELLGMTRFPFAYGEDEQRTDAVNEQFRSGERCLRTRSGRIVDVDVRSGHIVLDQEDRIILYIRDITEEKKLKQQLIHTEKMTLMGRLAGGIAHEIRNPLAAVLLNVQYLLQKQEHDSPDRSFIDSAVEGANRINQVVQNTLNLARSSPPFLKEESMNEIVKGALWFMKVPAQQKNVKIELHLTDDLPPVRVDAKQIQQVVINLMQNAIEASSHGSMITVTTGALQNLDDEQELVTNKIVLVVRDSGVGIAEDHLRNIFEPLRTTKTGGTGLGLALSKHIMDQHSAELVIEQALGGGTIARMMFTVQRQEQVPHDV